VSYYFIYVKKKKLINKKVKKRIDGKCIFCGEDDYNLLDAHRIIPGGKYTDFNTITTCSLCHRKTHSGRIVILGKHFSSSGRHVIHCTIDGEEKWIST